MTALSPQPCPACDGPRPYGRHLCDECIELSEISGVDCPSCYRVLPRDAFGTRGNGNREGHCEACVIARQAGKPRPTPGRPRVVDSRRGPPPGTTPHVARLWLAVRAKSKERSAACAL